MLHNYSSFSDVSASLVTFITLSYHYFAVYATSVPHFVALLTVSRVVTRCTQCGVLSRVVTHCHASSRLLTRYFILSLQAYIVTPVTLADELSHMSPFLNLVRVRLALSRMVSLRCFLLR
jgi:ABC-type thiamin/hydroxymethylpyrimidine transport system permease subunit